MIRGHFFFFAAIGLQAASLATSGARASGHTAEGSSPELPDVIVKAPRPPTEKELVNESVPNFIQHHGRPSVKTGEMARWNTGVCPVTLGLIEELNTFVSARVQAVAASVGAPVAPDKCIANVDIIFTPEPQRLLEEVVKRRSILLGFHYPHQTKKLASFTRPIQGWYVTMTRNKGGQTKLDEAMPLEPGSVPGTLGSRLKTGLYSDIVHVLIVADTAKITGHTIGSLSDYLAMLVLSQVQSWDACDPLPSILDLMSSPCNERERPTSMTAGDLAYLTALYHINLDEPLSLEREDIHNQMLRQFKLH